MGKKFILIGYGDEDGMNFYFKDEGKIVKPVPDPVAIPIHI